MLKNIKYGFGIVASFLSLIILMTGCVPVPGLGKLYAYSNEELTGEATETSARIDPPLRTDYFVGLALSGGGSRAANFSTSVMWELHELGVLEHVQYISAVSGGALPAAYYALFKDSPKWNKDELRETMSQCFECWGIAYLLNPLRFLKFIGTSYDRSDVMREVFHNRVFTQKTFGALQHDSPRLILNASNYIKSGGFTFTLREFLSLKSDLGKLPISVGVMASAAYPGLLRNVTLRDFSEPEGKGHPYLHVFDGGVNDNLGIDSLLWIYQENVKALGENAFRKGCLLIMVDVYAPYFEDEDQRRPDTRGFLDVLIDSNALNAFSIFLDTKRRKTLDSLGFDESNRADAAAEKEKAEHDRRPIGFLGRIKSANLTPHPNEAPHKFAERLRVEQARSACRIWHIALTQIALSEVFPDQPEFYRKEYEKKYRSDLGKSYTDFGRSIQAVPTRFKIRKENLRYLSVAAELLVRERNSAGIICQWLRDITGADCRVRRYAP